MKMGIFRNSWKNRSKPGDLLDQSDNPKRGSEEESGGSRCLRKVQ